MTDFLSLNSRLRSCLDTILELEAPLLRTRMGGMLVREFQSLKDVVGNLDTVEMCEDDVERVEAATEKFLDELKDVLAEASKGASGRRVLQ